MRLGRLTRGAAVASLTAAALVAVTGLSLAQQVKKSDARGRTSAKGTSPAERASGVIVKVETVKKGATSGDTIETETKAGRAHAATHRLSINTNAVWRDWARDQALVKDPGSPRKDARKGDNSVATKGEPADANSLVLVDVGPSTRIETRFRAPDDETAKGSTTPEGAAGGARGKAKGKAVHFRAHDLKPGLFVEVDFRHVTAQNPATSVTVIRPIEAPEPSPTTGK